MEKKLPSIFANKIEKNIGHNEKVHYTESNNNIKEENKKENNLQLNINQKINKIFNSPNYVYKADVLITLENKKIKERIIGKNNTNLITINNQLIPIKDIKNIEYYKKVE